MLKLKKPLILAKMKDLNLYPKRDFHLHTIWTDGKATVQETLQRAKELDLKEIAITDHVREHSYWFKDFAENVKFEAEKFDVLTFVGCEAKVKDLDGNLDLNSDTIKRSDLILASVHRLPFMEDADFNKIKPELLARTEFELSLAILKNTLPGKVLAHPLGMTLRWAQDYFDINRFSDIVTEAVKTAIPVEINTSYMKGKQFDLILKVLSDLNPYVSVGSDAHTLNRVGDIYG